MRDIGNILREENGGDLTYFIEYFLDLLSRAVEEMKLRQAQKQAQNRLAEADEAMSPLAVNTGVDSTKAEIKKALLLFSSKNKSTLMGRTAGKLVSCLDCGKYTFTTNDIENDFGIGQKPRSLLVLSLQLVMA